MFRIGNCVRGPPVDGSRRFGCVGVPWQGEVELATESVALGAERRVDKRPCERGEVLARYLTRRAPAVAQPPGSALLHQACSVCNLGEEHESNLSNFNSQNLQKVHTNRERRVVWQAGSSCAGRCWRQRAAPIKGWHTLCTALPSRRVEGRGESSAVLGLPEWQARL